MNRKTDTHEIIKYLSLVILVCGTILLSRQVFLLFDEYSGNTQGKMEMSLKSEYKGSGGAAENNLLYRSDLLKLNREFKNTFSYYSEIDSDIEISGKSPEAVKLVLADDSYLENFGAEIIKGSDLYKKIINPGEKSVVIGETLATRLFMSIDILQNKIRINGEEYTIIGVYRYKNTPSNYIAQDEEERAFIPFKAVQGYDRIPVSKIMYNPATDSTLLFRVQKLTEVISSVKAFDPDKYLINNLDEFGIVVRQFYSTILFLSGTAVIAALLLTSIKYFRFWFAKISDAYRNQYIPHIFRNHGIYILANVLLFMTQIIVAYFIFRAVTFHLYLPQEVLSGFLSLETEKISGAFKLLLSPFLMNENFLLSSFTRFYSFVLWVDTLLLLLNILCCISFLKRFLKDIQFSRKVAKHCK